MKQISKYIKFLNGHQQIIRKLTAATRGLRATCENSLLALRLRAWVRVEEDSRQIFCNHGTVVSPQNKPLKKVHLNKENGNKGGKEANRRDETGLKGTPGKAGDPGHENGTKAEVISEEEN